MAARAEAVASSPHPDTHKCDVVNIDYSRVAAGYLVCAIDQGGCGREWHLRTFDGGRTHVWDPSPRPIGRRR